METQVRKYNSLIRELLDIISADLPNNNLVATIHRRFRVALSIDRTYIIQETAPELLLYRDFIAENRFTDLIYRDWENKIESSKELMYEVDNNSLRDMVCLLRQIWENYDNEQKLYIQTCLKKLLSYCVKYHKAKAEGRE